jgi:hypothetical protein
MRWIREDLTGQKFGRLTVIERANKGSRWLCTCDCGGTNTVKASLLLSGNTKSCGCLKRSVLGDASRTHGMSNSRITGYANRTYGIWQAMHGRCTNPNNSRWGSYGGRGITVCPQWKDFAVFLADMGESPEGLTLERIDVNGNYEPSNCKWATWLEQARNTRKVKK